MPNEDVNMVDYINSFDATYLNSIMSNSQNIKLKTAMPQFVIENSVDFRETLIEMGIKNAYDAKNADFNDISENGTLYMGKTLQKTCINVDIGGIKAVASSGQEMIMLGIIPTEEKEIILNRPFIYIIADKYNIPLFIGAVTKL
jgi:serine protease inhibitor